MEAAIFEIDRAKKGGQALYELLKGSRYATLITRKNQKYAFYDLNELSKKEFSDTDVEMSKEQMYAKIDKGIKEFEQGKSKKLDANKINSFLGL